MTELFIYIHIFIKDDYTDGNIEIRVFLSFKWRRSGGDESKFES